MSLFLKPEMREMTSCQHGGIDYSELEELGISPDEVLDFSANLNPFGPPPKVREILSKVDISRYPDSSATQLRRVLAEKLGVVPESIIVGNGSTEIIRLTALAYLNHRDKVLVVEPTFGEYEVACQIVGASLVKQKLSEKNNFQLKVHETAELIKEHRPKGIFLCNPNNPTGQYFSQAEVENLLAVAEDSLVILDEAYIAFVENAWSSLKMIEKNNLLVLRSMTKDYALAGLRLGYGVAREEIIATLRSICPPWNVNAMAQEAGVVAVSEEGYLKTCQSELREAKKYLLTELTRLGFSPLPSKANFFLVEVGNASEFRHKLLQRGILMRDCTSFGLPKHIRIAVRTLPECQKLIAAVQEIISTNCYEAH